MADLHLPSLIALGLLYLAVFGVGLWASRPRRDSEGVEELLLAGRSLPLWVGLLTMTATWVGGGYISGTAEQTYQSGLLWGAQAGIGYALALVIGGLVFARVMRRHGFSTLVDPLEARFGRHAAVVLMIPAVLAEVFWSGAILVALGTSFGAVIGIDLTTAILSSASVAVAYTVFGGLRAVAYTDVLQLGLILGGLGLAVPFVITTAGGFTQLELSAGEITALGEGLTYGDWMLVFILGGIPWNVYFQRILATPDPPTAAKTSIWAGLLCGLMAIPPLLLGLAASSIDWAALDTGGVDVVAGLEDSPAMVLPYLLRYAVPTWVGVLGLGAVGAAVMSSVDSSILSGASLLAWNGYRRLLRPRATARQITRLVRVLVVLLGGIATWLALSVGSVAALWYLCGDLVYTILFPQLTLALFDKRANRTGALAGLFISVLLRLGAGEPTLGLPAFLPYPELDGHFPFRTVAMLAGLGTALAVSRLTTSLDPPRPLRNVAAPPAEEPPTDATAPAR
ncbi:MAG: sodium:solute symporter [Deltaproteobacteria bacterium]|nr:MAG: sodium:solute symporter [Deltaproteobacteria bacterium]